MLRPPYQTAERIHPRRRRREPSGISLLEVVISILLVGLLLVAALNTVGSATTGQFSNGEQVRAYLFAQDLLAEILELAYEDPDGSPVFGTESGETSDGTRAAFDDVDDYNAWSASPLVAKDGTPLANASDWQREVSVQFVDPDDLSSLVGSDRGVKRVTVTVSREGTNLASVVAAITDASAGNP